MDNIEVRPSGFQLKGYRVVHSEICLPVEEASLKLQELDHRLRIRINPKGSHLLKEKNLLVLRMNCRVYSEPEESKGLEVKVDIVAHFEYKGMSEEEIGAYLSMNAPAIVFPYVRAYISSLTGLSGIAPLVLPTLNMREFGSMLQRELGLISSDSEVSN